MVHHLEGPLFPGWNRPVFFQEISQLISKPTPSIEASGDLKGQALPCVRLLSGFLTIRKPQDSLMPGSILPSQVWGLGSKLFFQVCNGSLEFLRCLMRETTRVKDVPHHKGDFITYEILYITINYT